MKTLLLDRTLWDLCLNTDGNIAVADTPYALAQDAASAIRLFKGEAFYDTTRGVPHFEEILGHQPSLPALKAALVKAALTVPEVKSAAAYLSEIDLDTRELIGQVQVTDTSGQTLVLSGSLAKPIPA